MLENGNPVPRVELQELVGPSLFGARADRMELIVETQFKQHPMRAHRAAGAGSPQSEIVGHGDVAARRLKLLLERVSPAVVPRERVTLSAASPIDDARQV